MPDFSDALGIGSLPPPTYPQGGAMDPLYTGPIGWAPAGYVPPDNSVGDLATPAASAPPGMSVSNIDVANAPPAGTGPATPGPPMAISPPAQTGGGSGAIDLRQILGLLRQQQGGGFPTFMSALGAGLSSAGQNWNKPAAAAFASGAGAAIQGGQQWNNQQQDLRLKALQAAIAAWKVGDMAAFHRATIALRAASAGGGAPTSGTPPAAPVPVAAPAPGASIDPADASPIAAHRTALERMLAEAGVPPHRLDATDLDRGAALMAEKELPPAEAFEVASIHNAVDAGHVSPAEIDLIYGPGAADAIHGTATS
jgi:hypothetical protein